LKPWQLAFALSAFGLGMAAWTVWNQPPGPLELGDRVGNFSLPGLAGEMHDSSEWSGKVMVLNFWAPWCPPCRREIPALVSLQQRYGPQGVQFVGVALDEANAVAAYAREAAINYPLLVGDAAAYELAKRFGNDYGALPYTVLIDRSGVLVHIQAGELTEAGLAVKLEGLL
jgi:thiol-disulfide isomerase/thioredoxin